MPTTEAKKQSGLDRAELEKIAAQLDAGGVDSSFEPSAESESQPEQSAVDKDGSETEPKGFEADKEEAPKTDTEAEKPDDVAKEEPPVEEEPKEEVHVDKAAKEQERKDRSWKALEAEKAAFRKEKAELEQKKTFQIEQPSSSAPAGSNGELRDESGFTAQEYEKAARSFEQEGDYDHARTARSRSAELQKRQVEHQRQGLISQWNETVQSTLEELPEVGEGEAQSELQKVLQNDPVFTFHPQGFRTAARYVLAERRAASVPVLEAENVKLKKEITRLNGLLSVGSDGGAVRRHGSQSFDEMDPKERRKQLGRLAKEADGSV